MKIENTKNYRILTPEDGLYLCNSIVKTISEKVYLGKNADETLWTEVDEAEKTRLEAEWEKEITTETDFNKEDVEYAKAARIMLGEEEL